MARHLQVAARCFTPRSSHLFTFLPLHFCFPALPTDQPLRGSGRNSTWAYMGCCELYVFPGWPIMFIPNSRIHLEWHDTYKLLPNALHPALLIFLPFYPFTFVSQPFQQTNRYAVVGALYPPSYSCLHQRCLSWTFINTCFQSRNECWMRTERWTLVVRTLCPSVGIYRLWVCSRWCGMLFHVIWNAVPDDM